MLKNIESERMKNLPPYMFGRINDAKLAARRKGIDIIDLGMGNPDRPPAAHIVDKLCEIARDPKVHRYSASRGIPHLRKSICSWYEARFDVRLDSEKEAIATIGSKEGISHLMLAVLDRGDVVLLQDPTYPTYLYSVAIAGAVSVSLPITEENGYIPDVEGIIGELNPKPKVLIISYPNNPTAAIADIGFFEKVVHLAKKHDFMVIHDLAYSEICFDGYRPPSFLQASGAKDVGIEFCSMSKTYNMAGWRVGFAVGNEMIIRALAKIKGYYDYGIFTPLQVASIAALNSCQDCVAETADIYRGRRDVLVKGLNRIGWHVKTPAATMYVWAPIPDGFRKMKSLKFSEYLLKEAEVAVSPGVGFGVHGEGYLRFALIENEHRLRQAVRGIKRALDRPDK